MYARTYGLSELPFELTPNPKYLYLTKKQREALSIVQYGLASSRSLTLVIGEVGTGKTMLLQSAMNSDRCRRIQCIYLNNPNFRADDFVRSLANKFGLGHDAAASKAIFLERLESYVRERQSRGEITALVVDEAQAMSVELLEEIRMLANIENPSAKLLPLVLAGQPELAARLEEPHLRQLKQRVTLRAELEPYAVADTASYVAARIRVAGGEPSRLFSREAVTLIHHYSQGVPRTINVICDNALINAMALGGHRVDRALVTEVCRDLRLAAPADPASLTSAYESEEKPRAAAPPVAAPGGSAGPAEEPALAEKATRWWFRRRAAGSARPGRMFT